MPEISGPDFITILVSDLEASYKFYKDMCGLTESPEKRPNAQAFRTAPCGFAIRQITSNLKIEHPGQGVIIWWHTPDAAALYGDLKSRAVPIVEDLQRGPFGNTFSFRDPDGYTITVHDGG